MEPARVASFIGIMLNACELFTNFADEVDFVWTKLNQMTLSRWFFIYARYSAFIVHLLHLHYGSRYQYLDPSKLGPPELYNWILYKFLFWQTLVYGIDLILYKRVYSLYNHSRMILAVIQSIIITRTMVVALSLYIGRTALQNHTLTNLSVYGVAEFYIIGEIQMQLILIILAFNREIRKGPSRMLSLLAETGGESFISVFVTVTGVFVYSFGYQISVFIYPSFTGILSTICCRLLLNNHRAQRIR